MRTSDSTKKKKGYIIIPTTGQRSIFNKKDEKNDLIYFVEKLSLGRIILIDYVFLFPNIFILLMFLDLKLAINSTILSSH